MITLDTPIERIPRLSRKVLPALKRLGIRTAHDLLFHFPARYEDFSHVRQIADVIAGETVTLQGVIIKISTGRTAHKRMALTEAVIEDETGRVKALWFNQPFLVRNLKAGMPTMFSGKVALGKSGVFLSNPAYEKISDFKPHVSDSPGIHTGRLVPVYPETQGITSRWLRFLIASLLPHASSFPDPLPPDIRQKYGLAEIRQAIRAIHFPAAAADAAAAEHRFIFEELLLIQLSALRERSRLKKNLAPEIPLDVPLLKDFVQSLPFTLTDAQRRSIWEIARDLAKNQPMNRMLEGDVGSGKTVVAAAASLLVVRSGHAVAFMAPTEILARQHYATLSRILEPFHVAIGLITGSEKNISHAPDIFVGTHALIHPARNKAQADPLKTSQISNGIQKNARMENLGLVIIDEQHRFGVEQRAALATTHNPQPAASQKMLPHFLSMTATPIPRTLALTVYGDLDLSVLDAMPSQRKEIITKIVAPKNRDSAYGFIREEVMRGRQAFVICPRIEAGTNKQDVKATQQKLLLAEVKTVQEEYRKLSEDIFPNLKIGMLHGKMKAKEKAGAMNKFRDREIDILVSTSVVEVGVDIPNATIMMIEDAERFGLAQLHQFRGRVGRGEDQSYCFLFPGEDGAASRRLRAVVDAKNGFELAEYDLKIRGPGDLFGARQWGEASIAMKGIADPGLVRDVRAAAVDIIKKSSDLARYPLLARRLQEMEKALHLE